MPLKTAGCPDTRERPHQQPKVQSSNVQQDAFEDVVVPPQVYERWTPSFGQLSGQVKVDSRFMFLSRFRLR